jgi:hypothetical protein
METIVVIIPNEVKCSVYGCRNCLWASCECSNDNNHKLYRPETGYTDKGKPTTICGSYTYYD